MNPEHMARQIGEITTDIKYIRQAIDNADKKYAPYWVKYPVYGMTSVIFTWVLWQIINLIPKVQALF